MKLNEEIHHPMFFGDASPCTAMNIDASSIGVSFNENVP